MAAKGILVFSEEPYTCVLQQSLRGLRCDSCFEIAENLKKCTACNVLRYCNVKCQKSDWITHKTECKCLRQVSPSIPLDSVRLMLRIIIKKQNRGEGSSLIYSHVCIDQNHVEGSSLIYSHVCIDQNHVEDVKEIENDEERREQFTKIVYTLQKLTQSIFNLPTTTELLEVFGKMVINSFTICDGEMQSIGVGVYLGGSNLDHSCNPNAAITFTGKTLQLRTLEPVRDLLPSELRISYIDLMSVTSDRKKQLQQQYYFDCDCSRCSDRELYSPSNKRCL
ncbi:hypothetical protein KUTeg_000991 [Tegillarca granosa]|uniref:MYND-type domain-containing protein n=1 Tax=Tegillarca granosa TaxID=220873 RepID=A0ABQ9FW19_TEGGR|nr:hypothetical protein KUTeg_000991 [Tegillarca granosa]